MYRLIWSFSHGKSRTTPPLCSSLDSVRDKHLNERCNFTEKAQGHGKQCKLANEEDRKKGVVDCEVKYSSKKNIISLVRERTCKEPNTHCYRLLQNVYLNLSKEIIVITKGNGVITTEPS
ncbi:hypothetical protein TIFTF001_014475 [Ficus carica]|uniref:Uncharacterized protein n=1 Tax=Ficus carica TaxID=3494 RepID=A0AA88D705_FICCA|nr:hypothetical protein TIFTF001_014475 [Ficus carica]